MTGSEIPPTNPPEPAEPAGGSPSADQAPEVAGSAGTPPAMPGTPPPGWVPQPPPPPAGWGPSPDAGFFGSASGYPIDVTFDREQVLNQLWGIPLIGVAVRSILAIPHWIVLAFYGVVVGLLQLVTWIPVLLGGRYPEWGYDLVGGYARWLVRVAAYVLLLASPYPPFSTNAPYPVDVTFDRGQQLNRLWGIPFLGIWVRGILAIPHWIVLWLLGIVVGFLNFITWIPVLMNGRYPQWGYDLVGGYYRYYARVVCWVILMAGPYPPIRLGS
jgi:hypothetical protein